jgi:hypothetical protein
MVLAVYESQIGDSTRTWIVLKAYKFEPILLHQIKHGA